MSTALMLWQMLWNWATRGWWPVRSIGNDIVLTLTEKTFQPAFWESLLIEREEADCRVITGPEGVELRPCFVRQKGSPISATGNALMPVLEDGYLINMGYHGREAITHDGFFINIYRISDVDAINAKAKLEQVARWTGFDWDRWIEFPDETWGNLEKAIFACRGAIAQGHAPGTAIYGLPR